jgi:hypothetical protein
MPRYKLRSMLILLTEGPPLLAFALLAIGLYLGLWGVRE